MEKTERKNIFKKITLPFSLGFGTIAALFFATVSPDERASHSIFSVAQADILQPDGGGANDGSGGSIGGGTSSSACSASAGTAGTDAGAGGEGDGCTSSSSDSSASDGGGGGGGGGK